MEMLNQIQVRKSEAFSYISFSPIQRLEEGVGELKKKKDQARSDKANDRARERGSIIGLYLCKGGQTRKSGPVMKGRSNGAADRTDGVVDMGE